MTELKGSKTHANLKDAFAGESMANRRYLFFARQAETAEAETGHAFGHAEYLVGVGDPATDEPMGTTEQNLASAVVGETYEFTAMYPGFAATAREEGFTEVSDWFSTLARAERTHAGRYQKALDKLRS